MTFEDWWDDYRARSVNPEPRDIAVAVWNTLQVDARVMTANKFIEGVSERLEAVKVPETAEEMLDYTRAEKLKQTLSLIREEASKGGTSTIVRGDCPTLQEELRARGYEVDTVYRLSGSHETQIDWSDKT